MDEGSNIIHIIKYFPLNLDNRSQILEYYINMTA
jgi:hypothetical protein